MTQETFNALAIALENANFYELFENVAGVTAEEYEETKQFGLSFNVETNELQFVNYITNEDKSWVNRHEHSPSIKINDDLGEVVCAISTDDGRIFLWIFMSLKNLNIIIEKYKLTKQFL